MSNSESNTTPSPGVISQIAVGIFLLVAAVLLWVNAAQLPPANAMGVGPAAGLRLVAGLLLALATLHFINAGRLRRTIAEPSSERIDSASLMWGVGGMLAMIAIVSFDGGFILAATTLFVATARAFGKPVGLKSIGIGLALSIISSLFFTKLIMLTLPFGPIESILYSGI